MSHQVNITRTAEGGFKITEMGNGQTTHEHYLQPEISAKLVADYVVRLLEELTALEGGR